MNLTRETIRKQLRGVLFRVGASSELGCRIHWALTHLDHVLFKRRTAVPCTGITAALGDAPGAGGSGGFGDHVARPANPLAFLAEVLTLIPSPRSFPGLKPTRGNSFDHTGGNAFSRPPGNICSRAFSACFKLVFPSGASRAEKLASSLVDWMPRSIMVALGVIGATLANEAKGATLRDVDVQEPYSPPTWNEATMSYITSNPINWRNNSENVPANNQIQANGNWGSADTGLYAITIPSTSIHYGEDTIPTINDTSFIIEYNGVVNPPGQTDTFTFHYNLGTNDLDFLTNQVFPEYDALKAGTMDIGDSKYWLQKQINGLTSGNSINMPFENSPNVYVPNLQALKPIIPEPNTLTLLTLLGAGAATIRRRRTKA